MTALQQRMIEDMQLRKGFPFDIARDHALAPPGDEWWQPMNDREVDEWIEGQ